MPRDYRFAVVAALGYLSLVGASPPPKAEPSANASKQTDPLAALPAPTAPIASDYAPYTDKNSDRCYESANHDTADLCSQWRAMVAAEKAVDIAETGNAIAVAGAFLSFVSVVLVLMALRQGRKANVLAQDTAKRTLRPYVSVVDVRHHLIQHGTTIQITVVIKNSGVTPAYKLTFIRQIIFAPPNNIDMVSRQGSPYRKSILDRCPIEFAASSQEDIFEQYDWFVYADDMANLRNENQRMYVKIVGSYADTFDNVHSINAIFESVLPFQSGKFHPYRNENRR